MTTYDDAAEERTANEEAMPAETGSLDIRESRAFDGRRILVADSRANRTSLFADVSGTINSDSILDITNLTNRMRTVIWCLNIINEEAERDHDKCDKKDYLMDIFMTSIRSWMDDLDEAVDLTRKIRFERRD